MTTHTETRPHAPGECPPIVLEGGIRAAARALNIGERKLYRLAKRGQVPFCVKVGSQYIIPLAAFLKWQETAGGHMPPDAGKTA